MEGGHEASGEASNGMIFSHSLINSSIAPHLQLFLFQQSDALSKFNQGLFLPSSLFRRPRESLVWGTDIWGSE